MTRPEQRDVLTRQLQGASKLEPAFNVGWEHAGGLWENVSYSKHGRVVSVQGAATKSSGTPTLGDAIFTLPEGFRPSEDLMFAVVTGDPVGGGGVVVKANGQVQWRFGATTETDSAHLSGITFVV